MAYKSTSSIAITNLETNYFIVHIHSAREKRSSLFANVDFIYCSIIKELVVTSSLELSADSNRTRMWYQTPLQAIC